MPRIRASLKPVAGKLCLWLLLFAVTAPSRTISNVDVAHFTQLAEQRYGSAAAGVARDYSALITRLADADSREQLAAVNNFFNDRIRFSDDVVVWKQTDYWASPLETIGRGAGDCEDFTIAKFATLRLLGIPVGKLRLTYVKAAIGGAGSRISQAHMVLSYYETPNAVPLILDNLITSIRPANERPDLVPVFGFNSDGLWIGGGNQATEYDPKTRVSRWRDVLQKIQNEGLY